MLDSSMLDAYALRQIAEQDTIVLEEELKQSSRWRLELLIGELLMESDDAVKPPVSSFSGR